MIVRDDHVNQVLIRSALTLLISHHKDLKVVEVVLNHCMMTMMVVVVVVIGVEEVEDYKVQFSGDQ